MKRFSRLVILLCVVLQGWALSLAWPADGGIVAGATIQVSFSGGVPPYTLTVLGLVSGNADSQLQVFTNQTGDAIQWLVSVPDGFVRFNVTDAGGGMVISHWQTVHPDPEASSVSALSVLSTASVQSTSAHLATVTVTARLQSTPNGDADTTSEPSINIRAIVGGMLGGVATLLAIALLVFWTIRHRCPVPEDDDATQYSLVWNSAQDRVSIAPDSQYSPTLDPYPLPAIGSPTSPHVYAKHEPQSQPQPMTKTYGELPATHREAQKV